MALICLNHNAYVPEQKSLTSTTQHKHPVRIASLYNTQSRQEHINVKVSSTKQVIMDPYKTLFIDPESSLAEVKETYRSLALLYHPDKAGAQGEERMKEINCAYELILKIHSRAGKSCEKITSESKLDDAEWQPAEINGVLGSVPIDEDERLVPMDEDERFAELFPVLFERLESHIKKTLTFNKVQYRRIQNHLLRQLKGMILTWLDWLRRDGPEADNYRQTCGHIGRLLNTVKWTLALQAAKYEGGGGRWAALSFEKMLEQFSLEVAATEGSLVVVTGEDDKLILRLEFWSLLYVKQGWVDADKELSDRVFQDPGWLARILEQGSQQASIKDAWSCSG
ncbi:hypothetical protein LTR51_006211 [Lithohypha guttulata]|nr:hypothetical protein LTR51_006211 [Lithohypha guttulata]